MQEQFDRVFTRLCLIVIAVCILGILVHAIDVALLPTAAPVAPAATRTAQPSADAAVNCHNTWPPTNSPWLKVAQSDAATYQIDALTFAWKIYQESGFNPDVHPSNAGAIGIAQFMPATAQGLGIDPTDPTQALDASAKLDAGHIQQDTAKAQQLAAHYGGSVARYAYALALAAYNAGPGALQSAWNRAFGGGWPESPWAWLWQMAGETQRYVPNVLGCSL